jgi:transposase-like protein
MTNEKKTLQQMAEEALNSGDGRLCCPKCECRHFRTYGGSNGTTSRFRYKECRNCGHRILTASQTVERIVRDVAAKDDDDEDGSESVLRLLG